MDDNIELSNLSKAAEFEKQSREIDKMTLTEAERVRKVLPQTLLQTTRSSIVNRKYVIFYD